eukprot:1195394-Prorocentrum_minimum.AAC.1
MFNQSKQQREYIPRWSTNRNSKGSIYPDVQPIETVKGVYNPMFNQSKQQREYIPRCSTNQNSKGSIYPGVQPIKTAKGVRTASCPRKSPPLGASDASPAPEESNVPGAGANHARVGSIYPEREPITQG